MAYSYQRNRMRPSPQFRLGQQQATTYGMLRPESFMDDYLDAFYTSQAQDYTRQKAIQEQKDTEMRTMMESEEANKSAKTQGMIQNITSLGTTGALLLGKDVIASGLKAGGGLIKQGVMTGLDKLGLIDPASGAAGEVVSTISQATNPVVGQSAIGTGAGGTLPSAASEGGEAAMTIGSAVAKETAANAASAVPQMSGSMLPGIARGIGSAITPFLGPAAIVGAASLARSAFGHPEQPYGEKSPMARVYDDPGFGLAANTAEKLLGENNDITKFTMKTGDLFGDYAGNPIGQALKGNLHEAAGTLGNAGIRTVEALGINNSGARVIDAMLNPGGQFMRDFSDGKYGGIVGGLLTGGASNLVRAIFCFAAGTQITMADGSLKNVEDIEILDNCQEGGMVTGIGKALSNEMYYYQGVCVTGSHAVFEDSHWIRVRDSKHGIEIALDKPELVYIINNVDHILMVNGIKFADYGECDEGMHLTEKERLDYLNENCRL